MGRKRRNRERGAALVEFAIVLPVLMVLLLGLLEGGLLLFNQQVITNASREGARYGIVSRNPRRTAEEISSVVTAYCADHLVTFGNGTPMTTVTPETTAGSVFGQDLTVQVNFTYDFLVLPGFIADLAGVMDLQATAVMKYE